MASAVSTQPAPPALRFSAEFASNIPRYRQLIRRQRSMRWARQFGLQDDLEQLALLELARVAPRYDPERASSLEHFLTAVLTPRMIDCVRALKRMHRDITDEMHCSLDADDQDSGGEQQSQLRSFECAGDNSVLDEAMRAQMASSVRIGIEALPRRQREVMELVLEDRTDKEIGFELCVTVQAVNKTKRAAVGNLKRLLLGEHASN